jgi:GNAT superfamily N-acetyltransferase
LDDAATVVEFNRLLALETEGKSLELDVLEAGVRAALADTGKALYFIAELNGAVVGQAMVTYEWSDWRNGWIWWIQSVYVRQEARRYGVFRALFEHLERRARDARDVVAIRLYVKTQNAAAQETYAKLGFDDAGYVVLEKSPL